MDASMTTFWCEFALPEEQADQRTDGRTHRQRDLLNRVYGTRNIKGKTEGMVSNRVIDFLTTIHSLEHVNLT